MCFVDALEDKIRRKSNCKVPRANQIHIKICSLPLARPCLIFWALMGFVSRTRPNSAAFHRGSMRTGAPSGRQCLRSAPRHGSEGTRTNYTEERHPVCSLTALRRAATQPRGPCDRASVDQAKPPLANGQIGRLHRAIKNATVKRCQYGSHDHLRTQITHFMDACNFVSWPKTRNGLVPFECICKVRTSEPKRFIPDPIQHRPGMNI